MNKFPKLAWRILSLPLAFLLAIGMFSFARSHGWLSPIGIHSETHDSQVIQAIERTQEVSLLSLGIQGITEKDQSGTIFGKEIPWSEETLFLQYNFKAKLGIDGADVDITKTGKKAFLISIPEFSFIGHDEVTMKVAAEDGGVLSWITPDIEPVEMVNEILNDDTQDEYIGDNEELLQEQTKLFYDSLISSIDPDVETTYEFR